MQCSCSLLLLTVLLVDISRKQLIEGICNAVMLVIIIIINCFVGGYKQKTADRRNL